jgi:hypothetical protein
MGKVHRIPLAGLKCMSPKRVKELAARLGGEPPPLLFLEEVRTAVYGLRAVGHYRNPDCPSISRNCFWVRMSIDCATRLPLRS